MNILVQTADLSGDIWVADFGTTFLHGTVVNANMGTLGYLVRAGLQGVVT